MTYLRNQVAKIANINTETLRFYEKNGLIPTPQRNDKGYRLYNEETLKRLDIIKQSKSCGLTLEEIKKIIALLDTENIDYNYILNFIEDKLKAIEEKRDQLNKIEGILNKVKQNINCKQDCPIKNSFTTF